MTSAKTNMGRNDFCHCGSGKKYKKCCLEADQREREQTTTPEATPEDSEERSQPLGSFQNDYVPEEEQTDWDEPEEESGGFGTSTTDAPMRRYPRPPEIPEGSPEVSAIVDAWWEQFIPAFREGDLDTILSMIESFLAKHPDKVPQLFLHEEVLLDLQGIAIRAGRRDALVQLLLRFRYDYPIVYDQIFEYVDTLLAAHFIAEEQDHEISRLLDRFCAYPDKEVDSLAKFFHILLVADRQDDVFTLARATAVPCACSPHVLGYGPGVRWFLLEAGLPVWERRECSDDAATALIQAYDALELPFDHGMEKSEAHQLFAETFEPLDWSGLNDREERDYFLESLCLHFSVWLHDRIPMSWAASAYFSDWLTTFFLDEDVQKKNRKSLLTPTEDSIDTFLAQHCKDFFWVDGMRAFAVLQALWLMADHLLEQGQIESEEKQSLHNTCLNLSGRLQEVLSAEDEGRLLFADFPRYSTACL